jgi:pyruvate dehydrogenase E2 component (dihydrolipoamide acetyltransferase)
MIDVRMPKLSDGMATGVIDRWLAVDGEQVAVGDVIAEIETDKATMEFESEWSGVFHAVVDAGSPVAVGEPIATITPNRMLGSVESTTPGAKPGAEAGGASGASAAGPHPRVRATPAARSRATQHGLSLTGIRGSGLKGEIALRDVLALLDPPVALPSQLPEAPAAILPTVVSTPTGASSRGVVTKVALNRPQQVVARRMLEAKRDQPDFVAGVDVRVGAVLVVREQLRSSPVALVPTINDFVVRAVAMAAAAHPRINSALIDGEVHQYERVNVGIAVDTGAALVVPVVRDATGGSVFDVARATHTLLAKAGAGTIAPRDLDGGTITVSNLGMLGVDEFAAVLNPPQAVIVAVGAAVQRPVVVDGALGVDHVLRLTVTADHRVLYGADVARFLTTARELIERPLTMLVSPEEAGRG